MNGYELVRPQVQHRLSWHDKRKRVQEDPEESEPSQAPIYHFNFEMAPHPHPPPPPPPPPAPASHDQSYIFGADTLGTDGSLVTSMPSWPQEEFTYSPPSAAGFLSQFGDTGHFDAGSFDAGLINNVSPGQFGEADASLLMSQLCGLPILMPGANSWQGDPPPQFIGTDFQLYSALTWSVLSAFLLVLTLRARSDSIQSFASSSNSQ